MIGPENGRLQRCAVTCAAAALVACGGLVSCAGEADTVASTRIDDLPELAYVEEVRIGDLDDPEAGFSRIGDVEVAADGTVFVAELQANEVRVYGPEGGRVGTVGGPGEGPGEFASPASIGLLGDTLWVRDSRRGRISWFGPDGALLHETPRATLPVETDVPGMTLQVTLGDPRGDGLVGSSYSRMMGGGAADRPFSYPIVRFDRDGGVVDTLRWETETPGRTVRVEGMALHPPALRPTQPVTVDSDPHEFELSWWVSESGGEGTLQTIRVSAAGDTLARSLLGYDAITVPASVRDSLLEPTEGMGRVFGLSDRGFEAAMASGLDLPDHRPPFRSTEAGRDGSLWIELNGASPDSSTWVIVDPDLTARGRLVLPSSMNPGHVDGSTAWVVDTDELDVPWLVRLEVR